VTSVVTREISASPAEVWEILADGWLYPSWVVGASRMRGVDADWPAQDSTLHHSVGVWPLLINDTSTVLRCRPAEELEMNARGWPGGEAIVTLKIEPRDGGGSRVTMIEDASHGPARFVPKPIRIPIFEWRNRESLRRLAYLAEGRHH
jgi:uncharacterized protein YndB with AHSA1/START domain